MKIKKILAIFLVFSFLITCIGNYFDLFFLYENEFGLVEIFQLILIILTIKLLIKNRSILKKYYSKFSLNLKTFGFIFLFWEEISFITQDKLYFLKYFNMQSELNLHNSIVGYKALITGIPILGNIKAYTTMILLILAFATIGGNFIKNQKLAFLFLEIRLRKYIFVYPLNLFISSVLRNFGFIEDYIIHCELIELYLYLIFYLDTQIKFKNLLSKKDNLV